MNPLMGLSDGPLFSPGARLRKRVCIESDGHWTVYVCFSPNHRHRWIINGNSMRWPGQSKGYSHYCSDILSLLTILFCIDSLVRVDKVNVSGHVHHRMGQKSRQAWVIDMWNSDGTREFFTDTDFPVKPFSSVLKSLSPNRHRTPSTGLKGNFKKASILRSVFVRSPLLSAEVYRLDTTSGQIFIVVGRVFCGHHGHHANLHGECVHWFELGFGSNQTQTQFVFCAVCRCRFGSISQLIYGHFFWWHTHAHARPQVIPCPAQNGKKNETHSSGPAQHSARLWFWSVQCSH